MFLFDLIFYFPYFCSLFNLTSAQLQRFETMNSTKTSTGSAENAMDLTATCSAVQLDKTPRTPENTVDLISVSNMDTPKTQKIQLQHVFDLTNDSVDATYEWMRFGIILFLYVFSFLIVCIQPKHNTDVRNRQRQESCLDRRRKVFNARYRTRSS